MILIYNEVDGVSVNGYEFWVVGGISCRFLFDSALIKGYSVKERTLALN